jgi:hypothetical protein
MPKTSANQSALSLLDQKSPVIALQWAQVVWFGACGWVFIFTVPQNEKRQILLPGTAKPRFSSHFLDSWNGGL